MGIGRTDPTRDAQEFGRLIQEQERAVERLAAMYSERMRTAISSVREEIEKLTEKVTGLSEKAGKALETVKELGELAVEGPQERGRAQATRDDVAPQEQESARPARDDAAPNMGAQIDVLAGEASATGKVVAEMHGTTQEMRAVLDKIVEVLQEIRDLLRHPTSPVI